MTRPLEIELRASRSLIVFLLVGHFLAIFAAANGLPAVPAFIISAAIGLSLLGQLPFVLLRRTGSIRVIHIATDGLIRYQDRDGTWHSATLGRHAYASAWLVILPLTDQSGTPHHAVLLADSTEKEDFRRVRVWLHWAKPGATRHGAVP